MSGIRLQPGAPRHMGGSNRTIIKQAQRCLSTSGRPSHGNRSAGSSPSTLYELVEGSLSTERRTTSTTSTSDSAETRGWRLEHSGGQSDLALLEFVRDLPRTEKNIAAVLVDEVGKPAPIEEVRAALQRLKDAQFVLETAEGYKLLTREEKQWEQKREAQLNPRPKERNELVRAMLESIFGDPKLTTYRYRDLRTFKLAVSIAGARLTTGQIPLTLLIAESPEEVPAKLDAARQESRLPAHSHDLYWVAALTPEIDRLVRNSMPPGRWWASTIR